MRNKRRDTNLPKPLPVQPEELAVLEPRQKLTVAEWALEKRILSKKTSRYDGHWSHDYTPFGVEIMEALSDAVTREVWVKKSVQGGGTSFAENFIGQTVDEDPCPMGIVQPTENDVKKFLRTRLKPMFQAMPSLRKHLPDGDIENFRTGQETELDNMFLFIMWSGSTAAMASVSLRKIVLDEVAKYKKEIGGEVGAIEGARDRLTTFYQISKLYALSTPAIAGDVFDIEYSDTDQRENWIQCVFCKQRHIPRWEYVEMEKDSLRQFLDPKDYLCGDCARYVCPVCGKKWTEKQRWNAAELGKWAPRDCKVDSRGRIIGKIFSNPRRGYHISSFLVYPGFITMTRLAYLWAKADIAWKAGYKEPKQNFINKRCGESWEEKETITDEKIVINHIGNYRPEIIPHGAQMLTAGVDVHDDHFWIIVLGWGYLSEVWSIFERRIETGDTRELNNYNILRDYLNTCWPLKESTEKTGHLYRIAIDCNYRKEVVLDFCRQCTELPIIPVRGDDSVKGSHRAVNEAGIKRFDLNVKRLKDKLYRLLYESKIPGPGYFHLHQETDEETIKQLTSEEVRTVYAKGKKPWKGWLTKPDKRDNHLWDCVVYAMFAAEIAGATMLRDPTQKKAAPKRAQIERKGTRKIRTKY